MEGEGGIRMEVREPPSHLCAINRANWERT
jgi:hypothetical protein